MNEINLRIKDNGVEFDVLAKPGARHNRVEGVHDGAVRIAVTAPPEKGKANRAIVKLLSKSLGLPVSVIEVISGETARRKKIRIEGIKPGEISRLVSEQPE